MTKKDQKTFAEFWLKASENDLNAAIHLIMTAKLYPQGLFFLHLSIEKALKAYFILRHGEYAPFTHNLLHILDKAELEPSNAMRTELSLINEFNISTRYPSEKSELKKKFNASFAKKHLKLGQEIHQWLLNQSKSLKSKKAP